MAPAMISSRSVRPPISAVADVQVAARGLAQWALGGLVAARTFSRPLPAFLVTEPDRAGKVAQPERHRTLGYAESGGDLLVIQALAAQFAGALPHVILGVGTAGPLRRRLAFEGFVEGGVAHRAQDLLDLAAGLALAAELDNVFPESGHFLSSAHSRILVLASDILRPEIDYGNELRWVIISWHRRAALPPGRGSHQGVRYS